MKVCVVINGKSGLMLHQPPEQTIRRLRERFAQGGAQAEIRIAQGPAIARAIRDALAGDADAVIIGGGDGTVASALPLAIGADKPIGVLPMGTVNLFARDLAVPLDMEEAIDQLLAGEPRAIDLAEVNGHLFACNSMIGPIPVLAAQRERYRGRSWVRIGWEVFRESLKLLVHYPRLTVDIDAGQGVQHIEAGAIVIANNAYADMSDQTLPTRPVLDGGRLALYAVAHRSRWSTLWLFLSLVLGGWAKVPDLREMHAAELVIASPARRLLVSNDGELLTLETPLRYRTRPGALRVLVPPAKRAEHPEPPSS